MRIPVAYHPSYYCPTATSLTSTRKQREVFEAATAAGLIPAGALIDSPRATAAEIELAHDEAYVRAVLTGEPRRAAESQGFTWSPEFVELVLRTAGGQKAACRAALEGGIAFNLASGAHHAEPDRGGGFCTFNFLVTAPRALMEEGAIKKVMVIDLDEHQGNGTYEISRADPRFWSFDVSGTPFGVSPHRGPDGVYILLSESNALGDYQAALRELPGFIRDFSPDLIEYQAGMDCWEVDSFSTCKGLSAAYLAERDEIVLRAAKKAGVPIVVNLAGGYVGEGAPRTADLHVETLRIAHRVHGVS